jgi:hypothetical protein
VNEPLGIAKFGCSNIKSSNELKKNLSLNLGFFLKFFFTLYLSLKTQLVFASSAGAVSMWIQLLCRNFETFLFGVR